jgi:MFS family permease
MSEPLSLASLIDLFFLHERGTQNGIQALSLSIGNAVAPIVSGFLIQSNGWRWYHWLVFILAGLNWLLIFFFFYPETAYSRDLHQSLEATAVLNHRHGDAEQSGDSKQNNRQLSGKTEVVAVETSNPALTAKKTVVQELVPWSGSWKGQNLLAAYMRPWAVWVYPSFMWGAVAFALHVSV